MISGALKVSNPETSGASEEDDIDSDGMSSDTMAKKPFNSRSFEQSGLLPDSIPAPFEDMDEETTASSFTSWYLIKNLDNHLSSSHGCEDDYQIRSQKFD